MKNKTKIKIKILPETYLNFGHFLSLRCISAILEDFMSTLVIFKFYGQFGNFNYWVIGWVGVYP